MENTIENPPTRKALNQLIERGDSVVAIAGLFANVGIFGLTLRDAWATVGTVLYVFLILLAIVVAIGLWGFKFWGWAVTVIFSLVCILLVLPDILNYHAALVSMILLSYIIQPTVREKYKL